MLLRLWCISIFDRFSYLDFPSSSQWAYRKTQIIEIEIVRCVSFLFGKIIINMIIVITYSVAESRTELKVK